MTATMSERESMLRAVLESPEDDGPRLIFADFLEEHGEGDRAEFIRLQVELASAPVALWNIWPSVGWNHKNGVQVAAGEAPRWLRVGDHIADRAGTAVVVTEVAFGDPTEAGTEAGTDRVEWAADPVPRLPAYCRPEWRERERKLFTPERFWAWFGGAWLSAWPGTPGVGWADLDNVYVGYGTQHPRWTFAVRRGFLDHVTLPPEHLEEWGPVLCASQPLCGVTLEGRRPSRALNPGGSLEAGFHEVWRWIRPVYAGAREGTRGAAPPFTDESVVPKCVWCLLAGDRGYLPWANDYPTAGEAAADLARAALAYSREGAWKIWAGGG